MKNPNDVPIDAMLNFLAAAALVAILAKPLSQAGWMTIWWLAFVPFNIKIMFRGMDAGWIKPDLANGLIIFMGPITFYGYTFLFAWRKYIKKQNVFEKTTPKKVEKKQEPVKIIFPDRDFIDTTSEDVQQTLIDRGVAVGVAGIQIHFTRPVLLIAGKGGKSGTE